jgi:hypothetical protein
MVDQDVVKILAEIKQRVGQGTPTSDIAENSSSATLRTTPASGNRYASLPVLARTWDRLPPLISNRTGTTARLELWLKGKLKRAFRWFTWEQVNFNAATYETFVELVGSINALEQQLAETRKHIEAQREVISSLTSQLEQHLTMIAQLNARAEGLSQTTQAQLTELVNEFRLRDERLLDEQRVCFKQLSLELSESQVLQDRARRELEARVATLDTEK